MARATGCNERLFACDLSIDTEMRQPKLFRYLLLGIACLMLASCVSVPRREAPPSARNATPEGFPQDIRLVTTDVNRFSERAPAFLKGVLNAGNGGAVNILALSGGGSEGAFGAGAMIGLSRSGKLPRFQLVTGVSAGALIAPFAFLGPSWDPKLEDIFTRDLSHLMNGSLFWRIFDRLFSPLGKGRHAPLYKLVDEIASPELVEAVARESAGGRELIVATTDLDTQETVLWNMSAIAEQGGEPARRLFRDVLLASASLPGIFPPVLINVSEGDKQYEELHVDGGVTTPVFVFPLVAAIAPEGLPKLNGVHLYMIVNGQLATRPTTTPVKTLDVMGRSFSAQLTYRTRETIINTVQMARQLGMQFRVTYIPVDYPVTSFVNFKPEYTRALFNYGARCAQQALLWLTPQEAVRRNSEPLPPDASGQSQCPVAQLASPAGSLHTP